MFLKKKLGYVRKNHLKTFYHDYDCLNKKLIKHYKIKKIPEEAKKYTQELNEKPKLLDDKRIKKFINHISKTSIEQQMDEINKNGNPII